MLYIYTDGGCVVNKGYGAVAWLYCDNNMKVISVHGVPIKDKDFTNNIAEYTAIYFALTEKDIFLDCSEVVVSSDSQLVINQLKGLWKVENYRLKDIHSAIMNVIESKKMTVIFRYVPRENKYIKMCDVVNKLNME